MLDDDDGDAPRRWSMADLEQDVEPEELLAEKIAESYFTSITNETPARR